VIADLPVRERLLEATYRCVSRFGLGKTTVDDVVKVSGVSRATIYRHFPGGRDQLMREVVSWEAGRFFGRLAEEVAGAPDFATLLESALVFAHRALAEHDVLQKILVTEPDRLLPLLSVEANRILGFISGFFLPYLEREQREGRLRPGIALDAAADFVARMLLSFVSTPGAWNLDDATQVRDLVRSQVLAGVLA
jgi:AcrR family transcriptional regulator